MYKALAILEGRTPVRPKVHNLGTRLRQVESLLRSDASLGALKTAAAVSLRHLFSWKLLISHLAGHRFH